MEPRPPTGEPEGPYEKRADAKVVIGVKTDLKAGPGTGIDPYNANIVGEFPVAMLTSVFWTSEDGEEGGA